MLSSIKHYNTVIGDGLFDCNNDSSVVVILVLYDFLIPNIHNHHHRPIPMIPYTKSTIFKTPNLDTNNTKIINHDDHTDQNFVAENTYLMRFLFHKFKLRMKKYHENVCCGFSGNFELCEYIAPSEIQDQFLYPYDVKISYKFKLILVSDNGKSRIQAFDLDSKELLFKINLNCKPLFIELDIYDNLLVGADDECLYLFDMESKQQLWRRGLKNKPGRGLYQFFGISSITVNTIATDAGYGNIFVCDSSNSRIKVLSKDGDFLYTFGKYVKQSSIPIQTPFGLNLDHEGKIFVSDRFNHRVHVVSQKGNQLLFTFGSRGSNNGEFQFPGSIVIDKFTKKVLVSDEWNCRISIFSQDGTFENCCSESDMVPSGMCIDQRNGQLFVADRANNRLILFK
ncbi:hypothetical protein C9374_011119 [Naegleria lovaniensis]|uniref:NHL repeat domain-containing protein n=1 Tax=Naegleria lovaniensis TaxID=51637 RepID=A0AA88G9S9_NAELO|nr:uncharacterized protein C9374_011119 [Naegleria lovaniensis]KAG2374040.1 hypothetical protein C9374_011119 [Naegleria lovaniensis]